MFKVIYAAADGSSAADRALSLATWPFVALKRKVVGRLRSHTAPLSPWSR
jgi:hypothetical protein